MKKRLNGNRNYREVMLVLTVSTKGARCDAKIINLMASVLLLSTSTCLDVLDR